MSCGKPHDTDCGEVLGRLDEFLDSELDSASAAQIQLHLDECAPCLTEFDLVHIVKLLVFRSCPYEPAPDHVRVRVVQRISEVRISYRVEGDVG